MILVYLLDGLEMSMSDSAQEPLRRVLIASANPLIRQGTAENGHPAVGRSRRGNSPCGAAWKKLWLFWKIGSPTW
jgi:hypothetical protein